MGSAWPSRQGAGRSGGGGGVGTYQRRGRGDLGAPGGAHRHADLAVLTHDDHGAHGREWLFACSSGGRGTQHRVSGCGDTSPLPTQALRPAPGAMKLAGEGGTPNWLMMLGELKSSISSLNRIPLTRDRTLEPKLPTGRVRAGQPAPCPPTHAPWKGTLLPWSPPLLRHAGSSWPSRPPSSPTRG